MSKDRGRRTVLAVAVMGLVAASSAGLGTMPSAGAAGYTCQGRTATIVGTAAGNEIDGTAGPDVIVGLAGNDDIEGHGGNDVICGNRGNDELEGDRGNDRLYGGRGYDEAEGGPGSDVCRAEESEGC
jgi:Ca2+-binding RTX toxin-like protein